MKRIYPCGKIFLLIFLVTGLSVNSCSSGKTKEADAAKKPNIIFFIADDMTIDMFNCFPEGKGKNLTPNLDKLCSEGTLMMGQHVVSPVCTPSRFNCLTGRYASRAVNPRFTDRITESGGQAVVEWNSFIMPREITLPKLLREDGYATGAVGKNHVIDVPGIYIPKDYEADPEEPEIKAMLAGNAEKFRTAFNACGFDYAESQYMDNPPYIGLRKLAVHNMDWILKSGLEFLEMNKDKPFFLYFATTVPHGPYEMERSWGADRRVTAYGMLEEPVELLSSKDEIQAKLDASGLPEELKKDPKRGSMFWLDEALGELIKKLKETGNYENTIIYFFSDHGQAAKGTIYQGGTADPSVIWKYGGFDCGPVNNSLISNIDFAPTILDMAGAGYSAKYFDGQSFLHLLKGEDRPVHKTLYFEMGYSRGVLKDSMKYIAVRYPEHVRNMSVEERQEKLDVFNARQKLQGKPIHHTDPTLPFSHLQIIPGGGDAEQYSMKKYPFYNDPDQLYNLNTDPGEQNNLAADPAYRQILNDMKKELIAYLDDLPGNFADLKE